MHRGSIDLAVPVTSDPFNLPVGYFPQYISFYILGLIAYRRNWFFELTPRMFMEYQILLSPDLDLSPAGFVACWNEEAAAHNLPQARLVTAASKQYDQAFLTPLSSR